MPARSEDRRDGALENLVHEEGRVAIRAVPVALVVKNTLATLYGEEVQQGKKAGQLSDPVPSAKKWTILS